MKAELVQAAGPHKLAIKFPDDTMLTIDVYGDEGSVQLKKLKAVVDGYDIALTALRQIAHSRHAAPATTAQDALMEIGRI
jgi:hypothetical protein